LLQKTQIADLTHTNKELNNHLDNLTEGKTTYLLGLHAISIKTYNILCKAYTIYQEKIAYSVQL